LGIGNWDVEFRKKKTAIRVFVTSVSCCWEWVI